MAKKRYTGHLLIANPSNPRDELEKSVIMIVTHTENLGVGIQINNPHQDLILAKISGNIGILYQGSEPVYYGGNINQNKIHVVHTLDWRSVSTVALTKEIGITNDISVLAAISQGQGPRYFKACSGYWLWEDGRLDVQLDPKNTLDHEPHKWEVVPATVGNVFRTSTDQMWGKSIEESAKYRINSWF
jgi:putative transcriptional regulator